MTLHDAIAALLAAAAGAGAPQQMPPPRPAQSGMVPPADSIMWQEFDAAPPLSDRERFAPKWAAQDAMDFNCAHQRWLDDQLEHELDERRRSVLCNWSRENKAAQQAWWLLACAWSHTDGYEWRARLKLKALRETIGQDAYDRGEMPPAVPTWRFREMRP